MQFILLLGFRPITRLISPIKPPLAFARLFSGFVGSISFHKLFSLYLLDSLSI